MAQTCASPLPSDAESITPQMEWIVLEKAKALVLPHHHEVCSPANIDAVDGIFAPDFVGQRPGQPDWVGPDAVKQALVNARAAFPDFVERVEDVIVEGDRVVTRFTASGTHLGPYRGLAPTGRRMQMAEMAVFRIAGNRIVEKWGLMDRSIGPLLRRAGRGPLNRCRVLVVAGNLAATGY